MRIWFIGLIILALIWAAGLTARAFEVSVPISALIGLSVLTLAGVGASFFWRRQRARAAARALERELLKQSEQPTSPERQAELVQLQVQFKRGIDALKSSRLGESGGNVLYVLPWYVIVGPSGAGKTTALRHSGLNFPFLDPREGGGVKGVGGTRNCDWWFTNEAVLLDTAGRYTTGAGDRDEWFSFLGALRKYRPHKPINGVVLAVSCQDLLDGTEESNAELARTLRARIDELQNRLDMVVPVYVMFTKTDLVAGFVEFFGDLKRSERDQVFGASFELEEAEALSPGALFSREFERLVAALQARAVKRLRDEHEDELRQRVFQFPLEMNALRTVIPEFLNALFGDTGQPEKPLFRGIYFTSGTQEGNPVERVLGGIARAFGLSPMPSSRPAVEPKSYFVTDVFRRVIFPEQNVAARTRREQRRQLIGRIAVAAAAVLLALIILLPPLLSFRKNMALVDAARGATETARKTDWAAPIPIAQKVEPLQTLREQLKQLDTWREQGPPVGMRWGMYAGDNVYPGLRETYIKAIERGLEPLAKRLEQHLRTVTLDDDDSDAYGETYNRLKLYLMLGTPERLDVEWAKSALAREWAKALGAKEPNAPEVLEPYAEHYLELLKRGEAQPWPLDQNTVRRARTELLRKPQLDRLYSALIHDANVEIKPIRHIDVFTGSTQPFFKSKQNVEVPGAYTKPGWERVKKLLGSQRARLLGEGWVLGEGEERSREQVQRDIDTLRSRYFESYKRAWHDFFRDIEVHEPADAETALAELSALSEPEWVYRRLLKLLWENATLDVRDEDADSQVAGLIEKGKQAVAKKLGVSEAKKPTVTPVSTVEEAFRPLGEFGVPPPTEPNKKPDATGLDTYQGAIAKLVGLLTDMKDGESDPDPQKVVTEFEAAYRTTTELLANQTGYTRPMISPLLIRPIAYAWAGVVKDAGGAATGLWETTVWPVWRNKLEARYPFVMSSSEASLADFTEFFKPKDGLLWGFYETNLKGSLRRVGTAYEPTRRFQTSMKYTPNFVEKCLSRGDEITSAIFGADGKAKVDFRINLHSVSPEVHEVALEIDGASKVYKNHPEEWLETQWPAEKPETPGAKVRIRGENGLDEQIIRPGDFGFYRLLDAASEIVPGTAGGKKGGAPVYVATWNLRTHGAFIKLDIMLDQNDRSTTPLLFRDYTCPRVITR